MRKKRYYNPPCINETRGGVDLLQQASRGHMQLSTPKLHTPGAERECTTPPSRKDYK